MDEGHMLLSATAAKHRRTRRPSMADGWLTPAEMVDKRAQMRAGDIPGLHVFPNVTGESVARCTVLCSAGCTVINGVRFNGDKANRPSAIHDCERFLFLDVAIFDPH